MGPVARSAFEVYQEIYKKKKKKQPQPHFLKADLDRSVANDSKAEGGGIERPILNVPSQKMQAKKGKAEKKSLKRLAPAASKPVNIISKHTKKRRVKKFEELNQEMNSDNSSELSPIMDIPMGLFSGRFPKNGSATSPQSKPAIVADGSPKKANSGPSKKLIDGPVKKSVEASKKLLNGTSKRPADKALKRPVRLTQNTSSSEEVSPKQETAVNGAKSFKPSVAGDKEICSKQKHSKNGEKSGLKTAARPLQKTEEADLTIFDSREEGRKVLNWLLTPVNVDDFLKKYWEQRPLYINRSHHRKFLLNILSSEDIDQALRDNSIHFTRNIDVTSYTNGVRETHNPVGRAHASTVWDYYRNGCSVRILNPQTYFPKIRKICTSLQECFNSFVGANVYLTPPNSQGFAPHYDDIEAFVLQLEGKKKWRVYAPRKGEKLPRTSSRNFSQDEVKEPVLEIELQAGDLLYMPRGFIHQASTVSNEHSLHVTISTYQHNSWADLLEKLIPAALESAIANDPEFREGVPWDFMQNMGVAYSTDDTPRRKEITDKVKRLFSKLFEHAPVDAAADQLAKEFLHESLPPMLHSSEKRVSVYGDGCIMKNGNVGPLKQLTPDSSIKLVRHSVLRLVAEDDSDTVKVYHSVDNSLVYKEEEQQWIELSVELAPAVEELIRAYPEFTEVSDLPLEDEEQKLQIAVALWERGLVMTKEPVGEVSLNVSQD